MQDPSMPRQEFTFESLLQTSAVQENVRVLRWYFPTQTLPTPSKTPPHTHYLSTKFKININSKQRANNIF